MSNAFLMHMAVALVWLFLSGNTGLGNFFLALVLTFLLIAVFQKPLHCQDYVRRTIGFFRFLFKLLKEIVVSNIRIMGVAISPRAGEVEGLFVDYNVEGHTDFEVLLIAFCIGLSPGTIVANRSPDGRFLTLHTFAAGTSEEIQQKLDSTLSTGICSFTR